MVLLLALDIDLLQSVSVHCTHVHTKVTDSGSVTWLEIGWCYRRRFVSGSAEVRVRFCGGSCQVVRRFVSGFAEVRVRCNGLYSEVALAKK